MKLKGKKIADANMEICIIPRGNGEDIIFKCQAVLDMTEFDRLCPEPKVPKRRVKDKIIEDLDDPLYKGMVALRDEKRIAYYVIKSLEATEDLEWETVKMGDSDTWKNYETELKESGFSQIEVARILNTCMVANCLSEARLEQARKDFLAGVVKEPLLLSIPNGEHKNMLFGELVKDSESDHQES